MPVRRLVMNRLGKYAKSGAGRLSKGVAFIDQRLDAIMKAKDAIIGVMLIAAAVGIIFLALAIFIIGYVFGLGFNLAS